MISYFNWELYFIFYLYVQSLLQLGPNKQVLSDRPKYMVVLSIYIYTHVVVCRLKSDKSSLISRFISILITRIKRSKVQLP